MWPRGRHYPPAQSRGAGLGGTGNYPLTLGFNQYPQPQQGHSLHGLQGGFRGQTQNYRKPNKKDRAKPRQQGYSFYSDESQNSNYSSTTGGSRAGYTYGGGGIINAAMRNLPPKQPLTNRKDDSNRENDRVPSRAESNRTEQDRHSQSKDKRNQSRASREIETDSQMRMYFCPKCGENYAYRHTQNKYIGKIPLILHCNHTMCQECVYQNLKNYKVNCPTCQTDSTLTQEETPVCQTDMQKVFQPNFYIIGIISYYRPQGGYLGNLENMKFVSSGPKKSSSYVDPSDSCCFATCSKRATIYCPSCEGIYCVDCCTVVHKSTKKLMTHEPVPRRKDKFSLMLENCGEHPQMQVEFFCKNCDLTACCYCVLDKHTDHERVPLYHLNETEMEEFKKLKKIAEKALREVLHTQKKTARLINFNTGSVRKDVCQYFANCHAKFENLEKKLIDELENFKTSNRGLDGIQSSLMATAEQLKQLVAFNEEKIGDKKLNLRGALEKLRDIENIPRFLLNEDGKAEPVRFVVNTTFVEALDDNFSIEKCEDSEYRLVNEKELPENYIIDIDDSDSEVEGNINATVAQSHLSEDMVDSKLNDLTRMVSVSAANSISSRQVQRHTKPPELKKRKLGKDMERVDVQHINSMDSFYIQHKNNMSKLVQLNKDIENYVKMGGAQAVEEPELNILYLALYVNESQNQKEQRWCRARLTEIKQSENGPLYEMFFIDYGKTQMVDGSRIKDIPPSLAHRKPFAVECMLHNPMSVNWNKRAHYSLAKILNGKDVYMMVKSINSGVHEVDLMIASSDGGVTSVTDILIHATNSVGPINDDNLSMDGSVSLRKEGYLPTLRVFPNSKRFVKNQKEKVIIANVVDPHNIFVHLVQHQDAFKSMTHAIKKSYKSSKASGCIPIEGTYVLVEYKDSIRSNWHRAFIKSVDLNSDKVHVLLVDWGINVVVPTPTIKPLQETYTKLESQAVLVKMAHIAPYSAQATWSPHAANFLQGYHQSQDVLKMVVHDVEHGVEVALFDITSNTDICLNALMVENNLADSTGPTSTKLEWPQYDIKNPTFSDDEGLMASMLKKADEEVIEDSDEEDYVKIKKRLVDVVKIEAPDCLWVKFVDFKARESEMFKELQIHYSEDPKTKNKWKNGEDCVVEVEHEYGRGKILEDVGGDYKVYLYDKVKEVTVPLEKIYIYDKYFMRYPQAVIRCHLANIRPAGDTGKWSSSSIEALQELFAKHTRIYASKAPETDSDSTKKGMPLDMWYAHIIQGGPLDPDKLKYVSINKFLVKLGFAYKIPRPAISQPSTSPIKTAKNGEDLLKVAKILEKPLEEKPIYEKEEEKASDLTAISTDQTKSEDAKAVLTVAEKAKSKKRSPKKDKSPRTQCMKILESLKTVKPNLAKSDLSENKKTEQDTCDSITTEGKDKNKKQDVEKMSRDGDGDSIKNWNAIVDQELGEPSEKPKSDEEGKQDADDESDSSPYHKTEVAIDDWLPTFRLTKKDFRAKVTCVETCGHLYIHEEAMDDVYYKMEANIKEYFDTNPPEISDHQWAPGQLCTIKYTDGNWYRGKILKVKNPKEISVFMIDFGSDHDLSPDVLFREILYTDIGAFATKVKLDKVYTKSGVWLASDYDHFHDLVTDWCRIVVKGPIDVELPLVDVYNDSGVFVNQKLVELCPNLSRCSNFPIQQDIEEEEDTVVIESIESEEPFAGQVMKMIMDSVNQELDKKTLPLEEISLEKDVKKTMQYKKRPLPQDFAKGKKILLEIGGVLKYDKVALKTPGVEVTEEMYDLVMEIQEAVDSLPALKDFQVGMPCLTPYSEDGVWCRARISGTEALDLGFVEVFFVDYGNSESISIENVKRIQPDYLKVPQQTWEAGLNIILHDDTNELSVRQVINSLEGKKRFVKIVKEEPLIVDIYDKDGELIYKTLIDSGSLKVHHEGSL